MGLADKLALPTMARTCSFNPVLTLTYCLYKHESDPFNSLFSRYVIVQSLSSCPPLYFYYMRYTYTTTTIETYTHANIMFTFTKHKEKPVNLVNNGNGLAGLTLCFVLRSTNIIYRKYTYIHSTLRMVYRIELCGRHIWQRMRTTDQHIDNTWHPDSLRNPFCRQEHDIIKYIYRPYRIY